MDDDVDNLTSEELMDLRYPAERSDLSDPGGWDNEPTSETYQDDLDNDNDAVDPFSNEATDDPTEEFGIPPEEYKEEMDKIAFEDGGQDDEDMRETIEDRDEADDSSAAAA